MKIYILSCASPENGGGIYLYELSNDGSLQKQNYYACDRPMYAVRCEKGICVLLREPFKDSNHSGYFTIDENLKNASEIISTKGKVACHLYVDKDVYVVNYLSGNVVKNGKVIHQRTGKSQHPTRQTEPHTHYVNKTYDNKLVVCDLGTDSLSVYDQDLNLLNEAKCPTGYGIRHLVFSSDKRNIFAINELKPSISVFEYNDSKVKYLYTKEIDCKNELASGAAIRLSKRGDYLYVSIREEDAIFIYKVEKENLTLIEKVHGVGASPRDFDIVDDMIISTNQNDDTVTIFKGNKFNYKKINEIKHSCPLCVVL